jgi:hypothetical protein
MGHFCVLPDQLSVESLKKLSIIQTLFCNSQDLTDIVLASIPRLCWNQLCCARTIAQCWRRRNMPWCHPLSGGIALGRDGDRKMDVRGYFVNGRFASLKKLSTTLHVNEIDRGPPRAVWSLTLIPLIVSTRRMAGLLTARRPSPIHSPDADDSSRPRSDDPSPQRSSDPPTRRGHDPSIGTCAECIG